MKLLTQIVLVHVEGRSEKVFEIDLCEVGQNLRVVNFRYGKRGGPLKDGSKTIAPVSPREADRILEDLINAKIDQGYQRLAPGSSGAPPRPVAAQPPPAPPAGKPAAAPPAVASASTQAPRGGERRALAIVERLSAYRAGGARPWASVARGQRKTAIERTIWRAGELGLREAEPHLLALLNGQPLRDYCVAWALGRCGSHASVSALGRLLGDPKATDAVRRIASEALMALLDEQARGAYRADLIAELPPDLQGPARGEVGGAADSPGYRSAPRDESAGSAQAFSSALLDHLSRGGRDAWRAVETAYRAGGPIVRQGVLAAVGQAKLDVPAFRFIRHIFKIAEYRRDAELFGVIAYRFEKERAVFATPSWEKKGATASIQGKAAFGSRTREYLRRRVFRTLRRLGKLGDPDFVRMAVGVLLPYADDDAVDERVRPLVGRKAIVYDGFSPYFALTRLLYLNSRRYQLRGMFARLVVDDRSRRPPAPPEREEAFPELWDRSPEGLLHLLDESRCAPVHEMASRALRANVAFCDRLDLEAIKMLLERPYEPTARLGFDLVRARYRPDRPDAELLLALARAAYQPARQQAFAWIDQQRGALLADTALLAGLCTAPHHDTREYARRLLIASPLGDEADRGLCARIIAAVVALGPGDGEAAKDASSILLGALGKPLKAMDEAIVRDLLSHPLAEVRELGGQILMLRAGAADDLILQMVSDPSESVRAMGMRLLGQMPDHELLQRYMLLARLSTHRLDDLRQHARVLVRRAASASPELGQLIGKALVEALLRRKLPEGAAAHVVRVLQEDLSSALDALPGDLTWRLLQSESPEAQELGGVLLARGKLEEELTMEQVALLASHEVLSVRRAAWATMDRDEQRVRTELRAAVKVLDARWQDSRQFAFAFFRDRLRPEDFTPEILVAICDSVREDVQAFGREMLTRHFRDEDGPELLRRLAEHPGQQLQLYTTSYLERYASGRPDRLRELEPYFVTVLSRPNKGRVGKKRVLDFLRKEGQASDEAAELAIGVLHRLSASCAVEYRAGAIEAMAAIHRARPAVAVPLVFKQPEARSASRGALPMEFQYSYHGSTAVSARADRTDMSFSPDVTREPTYFSGELRRGVAFREAMSALHEVVVSDLRFKPKDKSAYKAWVERQELLEWQQALAGKKQIAERIAKLGEELLELQRRSFARQGGFNRAKRAYFDYLYQKDRDAWFVLDPVITVHPDEVFFECFSEDESTYGRLGVGYDVFQNVGERRFGTTNIDYSAGLYDEFQKIRSYKTTRFEVDPSGFEVKTTGEDSFKEVKIDLPDSWVRGFLQVSSAMTLPTVSFSLHPMDVHNFLHVLRRHREKRGPRSMRYFLDPGKPVRVLFEPFGIELTCPRSIFEGPDAHEIRVWGRRRLLILERLLPVAKRFSVHLLGQGLPSFYVADLGDMTFTLGLSGWTANDWSQAGNFDLMAPRAEVDEFTQRRVLEALRETQCEAPDALARRLGLPRAAVLGALGVYTQAGRAMFDLAKGLYRLRELTREPLPISRLRFANEREESATRMCDRQGVKLTAQAGQDGSVTLRGTVKDRSQSLTPWLQIDADQRIVRGECSCNWYSQNKLFKGPCEHMLAMRIAFSRQTRIGLS